MANTSAFFDLILPGKGEYRDAWWDPINSNFETIDTWAQGIDLEIVSARFSKTTLSEFLAVGHETSGELKATPEVVAAHISPIYGFQTAEPTLFDLTTRISQVEWEMWYSREANTNLRESHAFRMGGIKNQILEGAKDVNGHPAWLGSSGGTQLHIDGTVTPVWLTIDGKLGRVRDDTTLTVSGAAGTKYLYATYLADDDVGKIVVDGQSLTPLGITSFDVNQYAIYFSDSSKNFTTLGVMAGDILKLIDSGDKGSYVVKTVAPGSENTMLEIVGQFPTGGLANINYTITDPWKLSFGLDTVEADPLPSGKFYIGEVDFDSAAIVDPVRAKAFRDTYVSEWRPVDVSLVTTFEEIFEHNIGSDLLDISVQASSADDGTAPIEEMSLTTITRSLALSMNRGSMALNGTGYLHNLSFNQGTLPSFIEGTYSHSDPDPTGTFSHPTADSLNPGTRPSLTGDIVYVLTGDPAGTISGDVYPDSSVKVQWTKNKLWVKNAESSKFYKGYSGTSTQMGYVRVIVRKRG